MEKYGWYEYDASFKLIKNTISGQQLVANNDDLNRQSNCLAFIYQDAEIVCPIFIEFQPDNKSYLLDYSLIFPENPPGYGLWRRVDDFLTDALMLLNSAFAVTGGWRSAQWESKLTRQFSKAHRQEPLQLPEHLHLAGVKYPIEYGIAEPILLSLNTPPPPTWNFIDCEILCSEIDLGYKEDNQYDQTFLKLDGDLERFKGFLPALERQDKKSIFFPSKLVPAFHRGEDPYLEVWYTYIDENVFLTFRTSPNYPYGLELSYCKHYGFRNLPPKKEFLAVDHMGNFLEKQVDRSRSTGSYMPYRIWWELKNSLLDAWCMWGSREIALGSFIQTPKNYGRSMHLNPDRMAIKDGYFAGSFNHSYGMLMDFTRFTRLFSGSNL